MTGSNVVAYIRVSGADQVKGTSLTFQKNDAIQYCKGKNWTIVHMFASEGESAKNTERAALQEALDYCRKHRNDVDYFLVWKLDRFARVAHDHWNIRAELAKSNIRLRSVTETIGESPSERFTEGVLASVAEYDNAIRKERSMTGSQTRIKSGIRPYRPPIGYLCARHKRHDEKKDRPDLRDPILFPIIQRGLRAYASGEVASPLHLQEYLEAEGFGRLRGKPTTKKFVHFLIVNYLAFYAGYVSDPWTGLMYAGQHEPMITAEEYANILKLRKQRRPRGTKRRESISPSFPWRHTLQCASCRTRLTGSMSRGRGGVYAYYWCRTRKCKMYGKSLRRDDVHAAVIALMARISFDDSALALLAYCITTQWQTSYTAVEKEHNATSEQRANLNARRARLFEMREDGSYSVEEFRERLASVDALLTELKKSSADALPPVDVEAVIRDALPFYGNLPRTWRDSAPGQRPTLERFVFPEGVAYTRGQPIGTPVLGPGFKEYAQSADTKSSIVPFVGLTWNQIIDQLQRAAQFVKDAEKHVKEQAMLDDLAA